MFDSTPLYKQMLEYLKPGETVSRALCRLGKQPLIELLYLYISDK